MGIVAKSTGHSRVEERKVANWLYISIAAAIVLAAIAFIMMSIKVPTKPTSFDHTPTSSDSSTSQSGAEQLNQTK